MTGRRARDNAPPNPDAVWMPEPTRQGFYPNTRAAHRQMK